MTKYFSLICQIRDFGSGHPDSYRDLLPGQLYLSPVPSYRDHISGRRHQRLHLQLPGHQTPDKSLRDYDNLDNKRLSITAKKIIFDLLDRFTIYE